MLRNQYLWLVILFTYNVCSAIDPDCNYSQEIKPGVTYSLTSPNYPHRLYTSKTCQWYLYSTNRRIRITCNNFDIFITPDCESASLDIYLDPQLLPMKYCGAGSFSKESNYTQMIILLKNTVTYNTQGLLFHCTVQAVAEDKCKCGFRNPSKIVGGKETGINEYPMMAGIRKLITKQVMCGGTIISEQYILTAAHCVKSLTADSIEITVGEHNIENKDESSATKNYSVSRIQTHPYYQPALKDYDISIITVKGVISFSNKVGPACLPFHHNQDSFGGSFVSVLGWGTTEFGGGQSSTLQKATLSVMNLDDCQTFHSSVSYRQICTYAEGADACQFDSGGPVLWQNPTTRRLVLVGIISYGSGCASSSPGVNTRVGQFLDWIVKVNPEAAYCRSE